MTRSARTLAALIFSLVLIAIGVAAWMTMKAPAVATPDQAAMLEQQLRQMRDGLSLYAKKHGRYPLTLEEMVESGELSAVPLDPITRSDDTWKLIRETTVAMDDFVVQDVPDDPTSPIVDIRSGASGMDSAGIAWSEY